MGSLKTLKAASLAATLATAFATIGIVPAFSADMPYPPAPQVMAPPPVIDAGGGFYLRGDLGVGTHYEQDVRSSLQAATRPYIDSHMESALIMGVGAGYAFNSWLRTDATIEYRTASKFSTTLGDTVLPVSANVISGKMSAVVGLANAYVDLGTWHRITPYLGLGIGFANLNVTDVKDHIATTGVQSGRGLDKSTTNVAWAVHAGLSHDLTQNLKFDVGYRYLNMGSASTGTISCLVPCGGATHTARMKTVDAHDVKVGMRWIFNEMAAAPMMPAGPLVRKY